MSVSGRNRHRQHPSRSLVARGSEATNRLIKPKRPNNSSLRRAIKSCTTSGYGRCGSAATAKCGTCPNGGDARAGLRH